MQHTFLTTALFVSLLLVTGAEGTGRRRRLQARASLTKAPAGTALGGTLQRKTNTLNKVDVLVEKNEELEAEEKKQNERLGNVEQLLEKIKRTPGPPGPQGPRAVR